jgi:hypothetical protein
MWVVLNGSARGLSSEGDVASSPIAGKRGVVYFPNSRLGDGERDEARAS